MTAFHPLQPFEIFRGLACSREGWHHRGEKMTFARIGVFEVTDRQFAPVVALFRDRVTPVFAALEGFVGYQAFVDEDAGRYIGISYWTSAAALEASAPAALVARQEASALGASVVGKPIIVREEFDTRRHDFES